MTLLFDELTAFEDSVRTLQFDRSGTNGGGVDKSIDEEDIIDEMLDLYLLAYMEGSRDAAEMLGVEPEEPSGEDLTKMIDRRIDGKTFKDRVRDYMNGEMGNTTGTPGEAIARVAETDAMRIYNEVALNTARKGGAKTKTWNTMLDERVRDTHSYIEGVTVPIDAEFYTYDGDHAHAPGQFIKPENDIGCRCWLTYGK